MKPKIRGYLKKAETNDLVYAEDFRGVSDTLIELRDIKKDLVESVDEKIQEADVAIEEIKRITEESTQIISEKVQEFDQTANQLIEDIHNIPTIQGKSADEEKILATVLSKIPAIQLDEKALFKRFVAKIPKTKADLKIIQESFETDPMSVIDKILELPEDKFKLKITNIEGLEQTISSFRSQITQRGYLHGGGDTVVAGSNITITSNANGTKTIAGSAPFTSPLTTKGDIFTYTTVNARLGVGSDGQLLSADSSTSTGLKWIAAPSSGVSSVSGTANRITSTGGATPVIDISASYVGQTSITTLGTITTGIWNGTTITDTYISSATTWNAKIGGSGTINEIAYFTASGTIASLTVATYPSLTELSYVKGVTSAIQTQLSARALTTTTITIAGTANQVISSAGAQDLSANRTWTLSLPQDIATSSTPQFAKIGIGAAADANRLLLVQGDVAGGVATIDRLTANTTGGLGTLILKATSSGVMTNGFGSLLSFAVQDTDAVENIIGTIKVTRRTSDTTGRLVISLASSGVLTDLFTVEGDSGGVGVGNVSLGLPANTLFYLASNKAGMVTAFSNTGMVFSPVANASVFAANWSATTTTAASGTHALIADLRIVGPAVTPGGATVTDTAALYVESASTATVSGGNYSIWVDSGTTRLDGSTIFGTTISPQANDGAALGTTALSFADLFLATGAVINFNAGASLITHSANTLTIGGSGATTLALGTNSITLTGSIAATGARVTKGWFTDIESTNMPTVGGTAILTSLTAPQFTTIELGAASDTTLSRVSAGVIAVEGVTVDTASNTLTLTNKRITKRVITPADATSVTPNSDNADITYQLNTQATGTLTINADAGTPTNGQSWVFKIKSTNVQTFAWNGVYIGGTAVALPTATTGSSKIDYYSFIYDTISSKWNFTGNALGFT